MTENCSYEYPASEVYFQDLGILEIVFVVLGCIMSIIVFVIFCDEVNYIHLHYVCKDRGHKTIWLLGTFPVYMVTCLIAICVPASVLLDDLAASVYMSVGLFQFLSLMFLYYGGKQSMISYCVVKEKKISLQSMPIGCLLFCLPELEVNEKNVKIIKWFVFQAALLQPVLKFASAVLWSDGKLGDGQISPSHPYIYFQVIGTASTLFAMYGIVIIFQMSKDSLSHQKLVSKFIMFPVAMIASNFQSLMFAIFGQFGLINCLGVRSAQVRASNIHHSLLLFEMFLLSLLMRYAYRRPDKEHTRNFSLHNIEIPAEHTRISSTINNLKPKYEGDVNPAFVL